jgi:hypothetical protein
VYGGARKTTLLLTLGTPHYSLERYPFGRVPEKLFDDDDAGVGRLEDEKKNLKNKRADDDTPWTASRAAQSTLALTNFRYPGAFEAGRAVRLRVRPGGGRVDPAQGGWRGRSGSKKMIKKKKKKKQTRDFSRRWARASRTRRAAVRATAWTATA